MEKNDNLKKGKGFDVNPQNINKSGAPRKSFATISLALKEKGVEPLTKSQFIEAYTIIFNSTEDELKDISMDKGTPFVLRLIIQELADKKTRAKAISDYRDYMFGKAAIEVNQKNLNYEMADLTDDEMKRLNNALENDY